MLDMSLPIGRLILLTCLVLLCGCIEVEERIRVHDDGSLSVKATVKVEPQYEAMVLPKIKDELLKKLPKGTRVDFSQRIDGKATVIIEADGTAAAQMQKEDGTSTITVSPDGFMKRRYVFRETLPITPEFPFPNREVITFPGSIESVTNGKKISSDTVEFDRTHAKRGDVFSATSTAFAFSLGGEATTNGPTANISKATPEWLIPSSIAAIALGLTVLSLGWWKSRKTAASSFSAEVISITDPGKQMPHHDDNQSNVFCTECGARNAESRKFCSQCGHNLG